MVVHKCNKEREIGMMVVEIKNLKETSDRIETKIDEFIETSDKKYAHNADVDKRFEALEKINEKQNKDIDWTKTKIIDLVIRVASVGAIVGLGFKVI